MPKDNSKLKIGNSKTELHNNSLINPENSKSHFDWLNRKLEKAEKSGFTTMTKSQILVEFKLRLS